MRWPLALLALLAGCDACGKSQAPPPAPAPKPASTEPPEVEAYVSLLAWTDARVAVSSTVDNPRDFPEHLLDGKLDTAWNGRTGDLAGGFVAFRIPAEARVRQIRITAGFATIARDGTDLFTANHRIKRVRVTRDGEVLTEVSLDIARRDLQTIPVDAPGGDFELRVLETEPGTKKEWKELVVSELQVLGLAGNARLASARMPRVRIGSLDALERDALDAGDPWKHSVRPWPTLDAYCKDWMAEHESLTRRAATAQTYPCADIHAICTHIPQAAELAASPSVREAALVTTGDAKREETSLALHTNDGWYVKVVDVEADERCVLGDQGTSSGKVVSISAKPDSVVEAVVDRRSMTPMYPSAGEIYVQTEAQATRHACKLSGSTFACEREILGRWSGRGQPPDRSQWKKP